MPELLHSSTLSININSTLVFAYLYDRLRLPLGPRTTTHDTQISYFWVIKMINNVPQWQIKPAYNSDTDDGLVALVAHNKMKAQMAAFVEKHIEFFKLTRIITTGSTGMTLEQKLGLTVYHKVAFGPLGGDQEIGALVTQGKVCGIFFFKDPLSAHQHATDIEALTRVCDVHNVPYATNASAGHIWRLSNGPDYSRDGFSSTNGNYSRGMETIT